MANTRDSAIQDSHGVAQSPTSKASSRVFEIPELVELILSHISPREVFGVLRVSRVIRDTAKCSRLQRKMWLMHSIEATQEQYAACIEAVIVSDKRLGRDFDPLWVQLTEICPSLGMLSEQWQIRFGGPNRLGLLKSQPTTYPPITEDWIHFIPGSFVFDCIHWEGGSSSVAHLEFRTSLGFARNPFRREFLGIERRSAWITEGWEDCSFEESHASWTNIKILNVVTPVTIEVEMPSVGLPFSPQRDHKQRWVSAMYTYEVTFSAEEATFGRLFDFLKQLEKEARRVNSGFYSIETRERLRKWVGVYENDIIPG